ncbi:MAG TPA: hypothetical protein VMV45_16350 [Casimicrobiaceae bacterium]|nr:hypothetical protein [Casimicrobiaceae bacterium]
MLALVAAPAFASFHSFVIEQLYSNADGTVQFIVLHETQGLPAQHWSGHTLTSTHAGVTKTYTFATDLPSSSTANKRVLVGTAGFAALDLIAPDFVVPDRFLSTDGGTVNYAGVDEVTYASLPTDGANAIDRMGSPMPNVATNFIGAAAVIPAIPVTSVEYYNASLDHYFISDLAPDIDALDSGRIAGWSRTGKSFRVHPSGSTGFNLNPVCRFYIPPAHGDSHFFSASPAECASVQQKSLSDPNFSGYVMETPAAFYIGLPDTTSGACPPATQSVYRLWNARADSNHRYTTDSGVKAQMLAKAYVAEGYGPDAVIMCAPLPGTATLQFSGGSGAANGALVRDGNATASANYQGYATASASTDAGPRSGPGEAIAFTARRPVLVQSVAWSTASGNQIVPLSFAAEMDLPITIWIVAGPFATQQQTALTYWQTAQQIYFDERLGVRLGNVEIVDATGNPSAVTFGSFTCGSGNANVTALQTAIGARAGRINVYMLNLVDGSTARGNACSIGGAFVAVATGGAADLLAHELGHTFGLEHIDDLVAQFDMSNLMHSASSSRQFITEGQLFRAHLRSASAINAVYNARAGQTTRDCDRDTLSVQCPAIYKRVWADGTYPPN